MKIRQGFVSNSSSSSYVVYIPDIQECINKTSDESLIHALHMLDRGEAFHEEDDYDTFSALSDFLDPYVIASFNVSSDAGEIVNVSQNRIKEIEERK